MTVYSGQTDKPLIIELPSSIVDCSWRESSGAEGGSATFELRTQWVSDDSDLELILKDGEGNPLETLKGKVIQNLHRRPISIRRAKGGFVYIEAILPAHGLSARSTNLRVLAPISISKLQWLTTKSEVLKELSDEKEILLDASISGHPEGTVCSVTVIGYFDHEAKRILLEIKADIQNGKISVIWMPKMYSDEKQKIIHTDLKQSGEAYFRPKLVFEVKCLGVTTVSAELPYVSWATVDLGAMRGTAIFQIPNGKIVKEKIPENGKVKLKGPDTGEIQFVGLE